MQFRWPAQMSYTNSEFSVRDGADVLAAVWAPAPSTQRASPVHLSSDSKGRIAYASNKSIYIRDLANPSQSTQYNGHMGLTSVAKFSPSGFYIASGGVSIAWYGWYPDVTGTVRVWDAVGSDMALKSETRVISGKINDLAWDGESQRIIAVGDGKERYGHAFTFDSGNTVGEVFPFPFTHIWRSLLIVGKWTFGSRECGGDFAKSTVQGRNSCRRQSAGVLPWSSFSI
jgi:WD40 repeat protein